MRMAESILNKRYQKQFLQLATITNKRKQYFSTSILLIKRNSSSSFSYLVPRPCRSSRKKIKSSMVALLLVSFSKIIKLLWIRSTDYTSYGAKAAKQDDNDTSTRIFKCIYCIFIPIKLAVLIQNEVRSDQLCKLTVQKTCKKSYHAYYYCNLFFVGNFASYAIRVHSSQSFLLRCCY